MARDAQRAAVWRRHLLGVDVVADAPFPGIGQQILAVGQTGHARALGLVDQRQLRAADQHVHAGRAVFESRRRAVHGRSPGTDHAHMLARQRGVVHGIGGMGPELPVHAQHEGGNRGAAQAVAARGQHQAAGLPGGGHAIGLDIDFHHAIGLRAHGNDFMAVAHIGVGHAAVPAQIVHPLQARDLVQRRPGIQTELGDEPGAKGQGCNPHGGAGQLLGRAQGFHARRGGPGAFEVQRGLVQQHGLDADLLQRHAERETCLAGTDDEYVMHRQSLARGGGNPGLGRPAQSDEVVTQAFFQRCQPRCGGCRRR